MKIEFHVALSDAVRLMDGLINVEEDRPTTNAQRDLMSFVANRISVQLSEAAVALDEAKANTAKANTAKTPWRIETVLLDAAEKALVKDGQMIEAIKHLRARHDGMGLKEAKDKVDAYCAAAAPIAPANGSRGVDRW